MLWGGFAVAQTSQQNQHQTMAEFLQLQPDCISLSDQCIICRKDKESWACSTPGIACLATSWECRATSKALEKEKKTNQ